MTVVNLTNTCSSEVIWLTPADASLLAFPVCILGLIFVLLTQQLDQSSGPVTSFITDIKQALPEITEERRDY